MDPTILCPADAADLAAMVARASLEKHTLRIVAGRSKQDFGRPLQTSHILDVSGLAGIRDYEPAELFLTAQAATPIAQIEALLDRHNQMLAFEPPNWGALLRSDGAATLGGTIACNSAGPRRVRSGAARDHFLGFSAVDGRGDIWKAGGKVVKNVTGYDMCKLQAGAFGTLSVLLEATLRVLPKPETSATLMIAGLSEPDAIRILAAALNSPHEVSAAAHLPAQVAARSGIGAEFGNGQSITALRVEGPQPSVKYRAGALAETCGAGPFLDHAATGLLWAEIGAVQPLLASTGTLVWRVCTVPSAAPALLHGVRNSIAGAKGFYDWGGGLLWLEIPADAMPDAGAAAIRAAIGDAGGHATLIRAPAELRTKIPVFQPLAAPLEALTRRVKNGFDPNGILNPGRMQQGI